MLKKKINTFVHDLKEQGDFKTLLFHSSWSLTLASGLSYLCGFIRDRLFAHTFGLSRDLDIYNAAFVIPDLILAVLIGTALSAAFIPIFTKRYDEDPKKGYRYAHQMMSWALVTISIAAIVTAIILPSFAQYLVPGFEADALEKYILLTRVLLLSPLLFTVSNVYGRILLSVKEFLWYGLSPALYNIGIVIGVLVFVPSFGLIGLVMGTVLGILMHLGIRLIMVKRPRYQFTHRFDLSLSPEIKETFKLMAPKMFQYAMWHLMLLQFTGITSEMAEGSVAAYNYARNFQSLPVSLLGIAIAMAMYTNLSHDAGKGNFQKFQKDFRQQRLRCLVYTILGAIALAFAAPFLIRLLLGGGRFGEEEILLVANVLQVYCIAVPLESLLHIYHRAFYSLRNTLVPSVLHSIVIIGTILFARFLAPQMGVFAIPTSFAGGLILHVIALSIIFPFLFNQRRVQFSSTDK